MTAAGTSNIFASPVGTSTSTIVTHTMTISVVSNGHGGVSIEFPTKSPSVGSEGGKTTYVLEWPTSPATATASVMNSISVKETKTVDSSAAAGTTTSTLAPTALSTSASSSTTPPSSSSVSALCYDPDANSHSPCPTTTSSSASSLTSSGGFDPSGATIVKSQASKLQIPFRNALRNSLDGQHGKTTLIFVLAVYIAYECLRLLRIGGATWRNEVPFQNAPRLSMVHSAILPGLAMLALGFIAVDSSIPYAGWESFCWLSILVLGAFEAAVGLHEASPGLQAERKTRVVQAGLRACGYSDAQIGRILAGRGTGVDDDEGDDGARLVDGGVVTRAEAGIERRGITVVKGSARPLLEPRVVEKGEIVVVEGSARPFVRGLRTHSLWEGLRAVGRDGVAEAEDGLDVEGREG